MTKTENIRINLYAYDLAILLGETKFDNPTNLARSKKSYFEQGIQSKPMGEFMDAYPVEYTEIADKISRADEIDELIQKMRDDPRIKRFNRFKISKVRTYARRRMGKNSEAQEAHLFDETEIFAEKFIMSYHGRDFWLVGRADGRKGDEYYELKTRQNGLKGRVPPWERPQLYAYMYLFDVDHITTIEKFNDQRREYVTRLYTGQMDLKIYEDFIRKYW